MFLAFGRTNLSHPRDTLPAPCLCVIRFVRKQVYLPVHCRLLGYAESRAGEEGDLSDLGWPAVFLAHLFYRMLRKYEEPYLCPVSDAARTQESTNTT